MSKLDDLIQELCPDGVECRALLTCLQRPITDGPHETPKLMESGIPFISVEAIHDGIVDLSKRRGFISQEYNNVCSKKYKPEIGDVYMVKSASIGRVGIVTEQTGVNFNIWSPLAAMRCNKEIIIPRFLFYVLQTTEIQKLVIIKSSTSSQPNLSMRVLEQFRIPVPPLPVQEEIVRILDIFTELTAELQAELQARKKQYEYYREQLYASYDHMPKMKLIDVADISRGVRVVKSQLSDSGNYPVFQNSLAPMGFYHLSNCAANSTYVISAGAAGEIGFCEKEFWAADDCLVFSNLKGFRNKFVYYFLCTKQNFIKSNVRKASIPRLSRQVVENLQIPVIPIKDQDTIIDILTRFDSICNDIIAGLPAEIEARQKQYEYYRDKLLTFKPLETNA